MSDQSAMRLIEEQQGGVLILTLDYRRGAMPSPCRSASG